MDQISAAIVLAYANEWFVERMFGQPLEKIATGNLPSRLEWLRPLAQNRWWLTYVVLAFGFIGCWYAKINIISWIGTPETVGRVISALAVGSGSELLHRLLEKMRGK